MSATPEEEDVGTSQEPQLAEYMFFLLSFSSYLLLIITSLSRTALYHIGDAQDDVTVKLCAECEDHPAMIFCETCGGFFLILITYFTSF